MVAAPPELGRYGYAGLSYNGWHQHLDMGQATSTRAWTIRADRGASNNLPWPSVISKFLARWQSNRLRMDGGRAAQRQHLRQADRDRESAAPYQRSCQRLRSRLVP